MFGTRYVIFRDLDVKARGGCTSGHSDDVAKIKYYLILATSSECSLPNPLLQPSKRLPKKTGCNRLPTGLLVLGQKARTETVGSRISKNRQPKSGCNRCRSGPVAVFLARPQPDFKTLVTPPSIPPIRTSGEPIRCHNQDHNCNGSPVPQFDLVIL